MIIISESESLFFFLSCFLHDVVHETALYMSAKIGENSIGTFRTLDNNNSQNFLMISVTTFQIEALELVDNTTVTRRHNQ